VGASIEQTARVLIIDNFAAKSFGDNSFAQSQKFSCILVFLLYIRVTPNNLPSMSTSVS